MTIAQVWGVWRHAGVMGGEGTGADDQVVAVQVEAAPGKRVDKGPPFRQAPPMREPCWQQGAYRGWNLKPQSSHASAVVEGGEEIGVRPEPAQFLHYTLGAAILHQIIMEDRYPWR